MRVELVGLYLRWVGCVSVHVVNEVGGYYGYDVDVVVELLKERVVFCEEWDLTCEKVV